MSVRIEKTADSLREFCDSVGISPSTAYAHAKAGRLRIQKLGGKAIVTAKEKARFIDGLPDYQPGSTTRQKAIEASLAARGYKRRKSAVEPKTAAA